MPKLLKRGKAPKAAAAPPAEETSELEVQAPEPAPEPAPTPEPPSMATEPAPPAPPKGAKMAKSPGGLFGQMYGEPGERSRAERDRQAALEFEQAVAPVMEMLVGSVPEASSPEEAARAWEARIGEVRPDPGAGAYIPGDAFDKEARVYYRLLRRDYEKEPRPSLSKKKALSHHLHSQYKAFPGTKGW